MSYSNQPVGSGDARFGRIFGRKNQAQGQKAKAIQIPDTVINDGGLADQYFQALLRGDYEEAARLMEEMKQECPDLMKASMKGRRNGAFQPGQGFGAPMVTPQMRQFALLNMLAAQSVMARAMYPQASSPMLGGDGRVRGFNVAG